MTSLSVNINKIATLRNARGEDRPDLLQMALMIEALGANSITVHPRPDQRHIKTADVFLLKKHLSCELNVEGYPSADFIALMHEIRPQQITLVPDPPTAITSNAGFDLQRDGDFVKGAIDRLKSSGSRLSIFIDPQDFLNLDVSSIKKTKADRIELYTKAFADRPDCEATLESYRGLAHAVKSVGMGVNAGHDLSLNNLEKFLTAIGRDIIDEVSIGHALICDALVLGMPNTIERYLRAAGSQ